MATTNETTTSNATTEQGVGTAVGFLYRLDKTISELGDAIDPTKTPSVANKIVFTANGLVVNGQLAAEPNPDDYLTLDTLPKASTTTAGITKLADTLSNSDETADLPIKNAPVCTEFLTLKNTYLPKNYIKSSQKGAASGVAELDSTGKVPAAQLPSYVDDVVEGYRLAYGGGYYFFTQNTAETQYLISGETGKIYVDLVTEKTYRWSGSVFVEISASLALGETSSTAYAGDKGKALSDSIENIKSTYVKQSDIETAALDSTSDDTVPSVKLVYNETAKVWTGTQAEYDALTTYDPRTVYLITDAAETVYSDLDFGMFHATRQQYVTAAEAFEVYTALVTNGIMKNKQVYMHCTYGTTNTDTGYHLIRYQGKITDGNAVYEVFSCLLGQCTMLSVGLYPSGTTSANWKPFVDDGILTGRDKANTITSTSDNTTVPTSKAVYNLVSPLISQLTWQ